jgi:hypothetical protein
MRVEDSSTESYARSINSLKRNRRKVNGKGNTCVRIGHFEGLCFELFHAKIIIIILMDFYPQNIQLHSKDPPKSMNSPVTTKRK